LTTKTTQEIVMRNAIAGCILGIFLIAPTSAWAVHPFQVEDTDTQGKGNFKFELNGDYTNLKNTSNTATDVSGVITAGTGNNTDVTLEVPYLLLDQSPVTDRYERGFGDVQLRIKYRTYENEVKQSAGFQIYTGLPTGKADKGTGNDSVLFGVQVMDQQECHNNILHVSAGYEIIGGDFKRGHLAENYAFRFGLALEHKITETFRFLTELAGEDRKTKSKESGEQAYTQPYTFMAGLKYDISRSWYVDLAARAGLSKDAEDYTTLAGTAWRF
jgi:hypothetical protein